MPTVAYMFSIWFRRAMRYMSSYGLKKYFREDGQQFQTVRPAQQRTPHGRENLHFLAYCGIAYMTCIAMKHDCRHAVFCSQFKIIIFQQDVYVCACACVCVCVCVCACVCV